jgi:predicted TIM-barrel fold metal-dependent hydrolase
MSLTIDTHQHILPDFFWQATENAHAPIGGLAPLRWSKETSIIHWDTALGASDPVLRMLRDVAGIDQVLCGTDFPYLRRDLAIKSKQRISQSAALNDLERRVILGDNASRLFPAILKGK